MTAHRFRLRRRSPRQILLVVLVVILAIAYLFPLYWLIVGSFAPPTTFLGINDLIPREFSLANFEFLLLRYPTVRWIVNSVIVAGVGTFLIVALGAMAGYAFGKKQFPGRDALFWLVIATMTVPSAVTLIPLYLTVHDLGWLNSYQGLIGPNVASAFGVFLIKQFMQTIPRDLIDAARVDGAGELRLFLQIIVPLAKPALGALAIFSFMSLWNDYVWPLVVIRGEEMSTLTLGVAHVAAGSGQTTNYGTVFAGAFISFLPMLVVFVLFQNYFVRGLSTGAMKG